MIIILVLLGMVLAALAAGALAGIMIDRWLRENRKIDAEIADYEHRGKHAASSPRRTPETPKPEKEPWPTWDDAKAEYERRKAAKGDRIVWERETGPVEVPTSYAQWMRQRMATVTLPEPGTYLPQPARDSGAGTGALAKLTDTGAMRAITEESEATRARLRAENAAWLAEWSATA